MRKCKKLLFYLLLGCVSFLLLLFYSVHHQEQCNGVELIHVNPKHFLVNNDQITSTKQSVFFTSSTQLDNASLLSLFSKSFTNRSTSSYVFKTTNLPEKRGLEKVLDNVQTCLEATKMAESADKAVALENAREFYSQYRQVIPDKFLPNYSSHCWKMNFNVNLQKGLIYQGKIGRYPFKGMTLGNHQQTILEQMTYLKETFKGNFSSGTICLPKVFLAGFPKCGSTYAFCFLNSLVHISTGLRMGTQTEILKEPHFWVGVRVSKSVKMPKPTNLAEYVFNFLPGLFKMNFMPNKEVVLIDGTPNMLFDSPRFDSKHSNTSNYCLIPSALPELLPMSKYVLIVRNPLKMLYSAFWFSCFTKGIQVPRNVQLKGPEIFHDRIKAKFDLFNECMHDPTDIATSETCNLYDNSDYGSCIKQRLHLLDQCVHEIFFNLFSKELPECGRSRVEMGIFYTHIRKLLTVVPRNRVLVLTLEQLMKEPEVVARKMLDFLDFPVPESVVDKVKLITLTCSKNSQDAIPYKTDPALKMKEETKDLILKFYKPFNKLLADLLQDDHFLWNN